MFDLSLHPFHQKTSIRKTILKFAFFSLRLVFFFSFQNLVFRKCVTSSKSDSELDKNVFEIYFCYLMRAVLNNNVSHSRVRAIKIERVCECVCVCVSVCV